ncbi:adenylyl-sulfate kinase [Aquimarina litoralis]|uniref:adenylyl-sulfate kinase n=1 Tax=Aquimarina litoralis TaxID=584605 RepID=UPI001C5A24A6|nr:adenylyl-sulfate kinase [Aquimarina litoralis]MBW1295409.1 adenylyl-sulfate kinase [Aquimarina litoralis]
MGLQKENVIWFFGLSGSGKTTLAEALNKRLLKKGFLTRRLDGDILREKLNADLGFEEEDRKENIRRAAEVAKLFSETGIITIASFITPKEELRNLVKEIVGKDNVIDIYVECSLETCIKRDVKGLYKKALNKEILNFTGIDAVFESPKNHRFTVNTEEETVSQSVNSIVLFLEDKRLF